MNRAFGLVIRFLLVGLFAVSFGVAPAAAQDVIKLGNLVDLTGPTSDQGKDIAQGRIDAVQYINERGEDHPMVLGWKWGEKGPVTRKSSTEADNV